MPKKSLYQTLQVSSSATPEAIKAAYEARLAPLQDSTSAEAKAERVILREAFELLSDAGRRRHYDEKLKRELFDAMSSGGETAPRPRPASARASGEPSSTGKIAGYALLGVLAIGGTWLWLDHRHTQRIEAARAAEEERQAQAEKLEREAHENALRANARSDAQSQANDARSMEYQRRTEVNRITSQQQYQQQQDIAAQRRAEAAQRQADAQQRRQEQDEARRSQQQLERDRRYLQELERNRGMSIPR